MFAGDLRVFSTSAGSAPDWGPLIQAVLRTQYYNRGLGLAISEGTN